MSRVCIFWMDRTRVTTRSVVPLILRRGTKYQECQETLQRTFHHDTRRYLLRTSSTPFRLRLCPCTSTISTSPSCVLFYVNFTILSFPTDRCRFFTTPWRVCPSPKSLVSSEVLLLSQTPTVLLLLSTVRDVPECTFLLLFSYTPER